jgi:hypothetical protein
LEVLPAQTRGAQGQAVSDAKTAEPALDAPLPLRIEKHIERGY